MTRWRLKWLLAVLCLVLVIAAIWINAAPPVDCAPLFLKTVGYYPNEMQSDYILNLLFFDEPESNWFDVHKPANLRFDDPGVHVLSWQMHRGDTFQGLQLCSLVLTVQADREGEHEITKLLLSSESEDEYEIGSIILNSVGPNVDQIEILENTATGPSLEAPEYFFSFRVAAGPGLEIGRFYPVSMEKYVADLQISVNGQPRTETENLLLEPGDLVSGSITFSVDAEAAGFAFFAPMLSVKDPADGEPGVFSFPYAQYGLPLEETVLERVYADFFANEFD